MCFISELVSNIKNEMQLLNDETEIKIVIIIDASSYSIINLLKSGTSI